MIQMYMDRGDTVRLPNLREEMETKGGEVQSLANTEGVERSRQSVR